MEPTTPLRRCCCSPPSTGPPIESNRIASRRPPTALACSNAPHRCTPTAHCPPLTGTAASVRVRVKGGAEKRREQGERNHNATSWAGYAGLKSANSNMFLVFVVISCDPNVQLESIRSDCIS